MIDRLHDARVRTATFEWLAAQVNFHGEVLPRDLLAQGFEFEGKRVPLLGPQGIFKPQVLDRVPLSITTSPSGPYDDAFGSDGLLKYKYRGTDPLHRDNVGLRSAMQLRLPLVYFHGIVPGKYLAAWPVFIVGDEPAALTFTVAVDDAVHTGLAGSVGGVSDQVSEDGAAARREYVTAVTRRRLHQKAFRERVLRAYRQQCAFCRLRHEELLDAAHITPDAEEGGEPVVQNGLALCKLHHAAFDRSFIGVRPDYVIEVRGDILHETDGPTLKHSIQALHGSRIHLPRGATLRPDPERLALRYERFKATP
jgi:putative restriction endonuclease